MTCIPFFFQIWSCFQVRKVGFTSHNRHFCTYDASISSICYFHMSIFRVIDLCPNEEDKKMQIDQIPESFNQKKQHASRYLYFIFHVVTTSFKCSGCWENVVLVFIINFSITKEDNDILDEICKCNKSIKKQLLSKLLLWGHGVKKTTLMRINSELTWTGS